jgi:hypothetical protein
MTEHSIEFHAGGVEICLVPTIAAGTIAGLFYPALRNEPVPRITSESVMDACLATGVNFLWLPPLTISVSLYLFYVGVETDFSHYLTSGMGKFCERS